MSVPSRSALVTACAIVVGIGVGTAQADSPVPVGAVGGPAPVAGPLPPVGSVPTTPAAPPSTRCGPATAGGDGLALQVRLHQAWPELMLNWSSIAPDGFWLDNDVPVARIDVVDASKISGLCAQAVAHGVGGDVAVDVVPTTQAQMSEMAGIVQSALTARFGYGNARAAFGIPSIKTWSIDIQIQPGVDRAAVDAIAQSVPAAYSVSVAAAPFPIASPAIGAPGIPPRATPPLTPPGTTPPSARPAARPVAIVPARLSKGAKRHHVRVRATGVRSASRVTAALLKGRVVIARKTVTASRTSSPAGAATSLRIAVPRTAIRSRGTTVFTVRVTMVDTAGISKTTSSRLRVS